MKSLPLLALVSLNAFLVACGGGGSNGGTTPTVPSPPTPPAAKVDFINPRPVQILGYTGHAMEPYISRDGEELFFNNSNAQTLDDGSSNDTNIHYAMRVDGTTFQYMGLVVGASEDSTPNVNELEGVPSLSNAQELYFIRTTDYLDESSPNYLKSVFWGGYANGNVVDIQSLPNFRNDRPPGQGPVLGELVFDIDIQEDGNTLYFAAGDFDNGILQAANVGVAVRDGDGFTVATDSAAQMAAINTEALEYAATASTDLLELYFSRAEIIIGSYRFAIFVSTRESTSSVWSSATELTSLSGEVVEAPSLSRDGQTIYFHQEINGTFQIFVADRQQ